MAVKAIPSGCFRQPNESNGIDSSGTKTFSFILKGTFSELATYEESLSQGDEVPAGWAANAWTLARNAGNVGTLTVTCRPLDEVSSTDEDGNVTTEETPLTEIWSLKSVRNDVSILGYCGSQEKNPCREWIEAWQKEPDGKIASEYGFTQADGTVFTIDESSSDEATQRRAVATKDLIAKIQTGIDTVMRFYPMLTCQTTYTNPPASVYANLACIDTPSGSTLAAKTIKKPGNLDAIISAHQWLKCQDDCSQNADGTWSRTQSWMGAVSWDENLYGTEDRWPMPYEHA